MSADVIYLAKERGAGPTSPGSGSLHAAEFYRHEAARLYAMADSFLFGEIRQELVSIARLYDRLAQRHGIVAPPL